MEIYKEVVEQGIWFLVPQSSNIIRARYLKESEMFIIQFKSGQHYCYKQVPKKLIFEFINSPSKGKFFYHRIRQAFKGEKCTPEGNVIGTLVEKK